MNDDDDELVWLKFNMQSPGKIYIYNWMLPDDKLTNHHLSLSKKRKQKLYSEWEIG